MNGQTLLLTEEEKRYCDYYTTSDGRRGVLSRRHSKRVVLTPNRTRGFFAFNAVRYSRVWGISFAGDVTALRVFVQLGTGGAITQAPVHLPLLSGGGSWSPLLEHPLFYNPTYPSQGLADTAVLQVSRPVCWILDPNIIVPNAQGLLFNFTLENEDAGVPEDGFFAVETTVHHFQFPGFKGGP